MDELIITKATSLDFETVKNLMLTALKEDPLAFSVNYEEYKENTDSWWHSYLSPFLYELNSEMFLARINGNVVGMVGIIFESKLRRAHLSTIVWFYVLKEYRKKGVGHKLMNMAINDAKQKQRIKKITLMVNSPQKDALKIYAALGFVIAGTLKEELKINDSYYDVHILEMYI